jgi:hypothetical protein
LRLLSRGVIGIDRKLQPSSVVGPAVDDPDVMLGNYA